MTQDELKIKVAQKALEYIPSNGILGVGSGSTVVKFIEAIKANKIPVFAAVSSSNYTTQLLNQAGIRVLDTNDVEDYDIYIDGADEIDPNFMMIKGGGACLTREKILASMAKRFICIADISKRVEVLGKFPLPVEVIPMAREKVIRELNKLGGRAVLREGVTTDNQCQIVDVHGLSIAKPVELENKINSIAGVVTVGLFAHRGADTLIYADEHQVHVIDNN